MPGKKRLDSLLVERGLVNSREKAKTSIMAGLVTVNGQRVDKPGADVSMDAKVEVKGPAIPYVSRGGLKLEKAISTFHLALKDKIMVDIGASTGGFTDCALQHGAKKVYAVDVGYGQLDWKLRNDSRVINLERTNIRYIDNGVIDQQPDLITIDVSFISLGLVMPKAAEMISAGGEVVALIKPQFEAGREKVGKKGVVRDPAVHVEVIDRVISLAGSLDFTVKDLTFSPIKGPEGNIEYLLYLTKNGSPAAVQETEAGDINSAEVVARAFGELT